MLLVNGTADQLINLNQAYSFMDALRKAGVPNDLLIPQGIQHDRASMEGMSEGKILGFLHKWLKNPATLNRTRCPSPGGTWSLPLASWQRRAGRRLRLPLIILIVAGGGLLLVLIFRVGIRKTT